MPHRQPQITGADVQNILSASGRAARDEAPPLVARTPVRFDGTINLGHVLTSVAMLVSGAGAYFNLDKRVDINARDIAAVDKRATENVERVLKASDEIRDQQKDMARTLQSIQTELALLRARAPADAVPAGGKR
jgi:hypothetical protein